MAARCQSAQDSGLNVDGIPVACLDAHALHAPARQPAARPPPRLYIPPSGCVYTGKIAHRCTDCAWQQCKLSYMQCAVPQQSVEKLCLQKMPSGQHRSVGMTAAPTSGFFDLPALWTSARTQSRCRPGCQVLLIHAYGRLIHQLQQLSGCGWLCPTRSSLDHSSLCNSRARDMLNLMLPAHSCRCSSPLLGKQEPFITPPWQGS